MNTRQKQFITSLIMLGMLPMIFAVLAFAEKTREDGHLPERNGRGSGEIPSLVVATGLVTVMVPGIRAFSGETKPHTEQTVFPVFMGMRCPLTY